MAGIIVLQPLRSIPTLSYEPHSTVSLKVRTIAVTPNMTATLLEMMDIMPCGHHGTMLTAELKRADLGVVFIKLVNRLYDTYHMDMRESAARNNPCVFLHN